ncbi:translational activator [Pseudohyphozyma bogoriensis]|nr:translational activator [Pseudohyphozyma bogoriensis]
MAEEDWDATVARIKLGLAGSAGVKQRLELLQGELVQLVTRPETTPEQLQSILVLLLPTLPRYSDQPSRLAVLSLLKLLLTHPSATPKLTQGTIKFLESETDKSAKFATAPATLFALLGWVTTVYEVKADEVSKEEAQWKSLVGSFSTLVERLLDEKENKKEGIRKSVLVVSRRAVRKNAPLIPKLVTTLTEAKVEPTWKHATFLGLVLDVSLRLKDPKGKKDVAKTTVEEVTPAVNKYWSSQVLSCKVVAPKRLLNAFHDFHQSTVTPESLLALLPTLSTSLTRTSEPSIPLVTSFYASLPNSLLTPETTHPLLTPLLTTAKSPSPAIRASTITLFGALFSTTTPPPLDTILEPLKTGKTTSPDHRITLLSMLSTLPPSPTLSPSIVEIPLVLLPKDSNEGVVKTSMALLAKHLPISLTSGHKLTAPQLAALTKAMGEPKPPLRRAVNRAVGEVVWNLEKGEGEVEEAVKTFGEGVLGGFEGALKNVAGNPLNAPAGALEGWIAVASLLGRMKDWSSAKIDGVISSNPILTSILTLGAKPSFLLYDKVYRKNREPEDEEWFGRALEALLSNEQTREKVAKDEQLRAAVGAAIIHGVLEAEKFESRKNGAALVRRLNEGDAKWTGEVVREAVRGWLVAAEKDSLKPSTTKASEDAPAPTDYTSRLRPLLSALATVPSSLPLAYRESLLAELVVIAHHPSVGEVWIELLQTAQIDPQLLVEKNLEQLLQSLWKDAGTSPSSALFAEAAYRAAKTLAFVVPLAVVPRLFEQIEDDLAVKHLDFIGPTEYGIWATPEGSTFVDVLSAAKPKAPTSHKNSKEREIEIWEAELREALARKKPVAASLSKADRILFDKQLAKETEIRSQMKDALGRLKRGFAVLLALVNSGAEGVAEYLATMVKDVLDVIVLRPATLVASEAFATYQTLADICSPRLGQFKVAVGVAVLRGVDAQVVPSDFTTEPLDALVTRVLYRLRFLAEQAPFDAGTFAYASPLVSKVIRGGGIGLESGDQEAVIEQVSLALDIISFHSRQCSDSAFPRLSMIGDLLAALVSFPALSRTATAALSDLTNAAKDSTTQAEIDALLKGAMTEEAYVRFACLQALAPLDLTELDFSPNLWITCHDVDERNAELALNAWEENALDIPEAFVPDLVPFLGHSSAAIRRATAHSIAEGINTHPGQVAEALQLLIADYNEKAKELVPQYDQYGMVIEESLTAEDPWRNRVAIALTLKLISEHFTPANVETFFGLLIEGFALGDRSQSVRSEMLEAAQHVIDVHGKETLQTLIVTFETYLAKPETGDVVQDYITEALIILFGRLARHLEPTDPRVATVIGRLVDALRTPSEVVQAAVCDCLPPLIRVIEKDVPRLADQLLADLFEAPKYAERRGAAYGLAGVIKGRGIGALREFGVLGRLRDNAEDKKNMQARQGAVFGYEILSTVLGRLFEPYVSETLPLLLASFGDSSTDVREATQDAAKAIMSKLSGHAVKLILPTLLSGLDDKQWRAKKGAIELMGAMAFLAPRQLSASLPTILPRLTEVLTDTHKQVRESANTSLKRFGEVVTNPEIQAMTPVLLEALVDPSRKTPKALDALLATAFAHFIDASSLALVVPILDRGLRERSADVKRKASAIVGNMATLTEAQDLIPYLSQLIPLLQSVLIDPVPEARSTAAKSLGGLVERLGEQHFPDLIDTLMQVLKSPSSGVDQQGAAQGVSEILAGLGTDRLEGLLPTILANTGSPRAYIREGHISLLIFLPTTFGERFVPYLGRIIQPVLNGLADDSDFVRDASMKAGRMIVASHSTKAIDLLLPELELGLFDGSWRIRQSSVQLVGDLLFRISGVSGKATEDDENEEDAVEDFNPTTEAGKKALIEALGKDRRDRVFASLYIVRQDSVGAVRQASLHIWKALVANTPRTVREMLPTLMQIIVRTLASPGIEQRETAARCLADTCRKLGEAVLGEVIAILQKAMTSADRRQREGVCLAITEIMANTSSSSLESHESVVIGIVRTALVDSDASVRSAAAQCFDVAQQVIGNKSIDETIPTLLDALQTPGDTADAALEALKEVMAVRADKIFPVLIPRLIAAPITAFNARALASLVRVAGSALGRRLTNIVDALQNAVETEKDEDTVEQLDEALTAVLGAVEDHESGLGSLQMHMLELAKSETPKKRVVGCTLFMRFCQATQSDFSDYTVDWIRQLVSLFDDRATEVVGSAWMALDALVKTIDKEDMEPLVVPLRRTIESTGSPGTPVDGFSRPNGLKPILPILLQGLLAGTSEQREQAAYALGDLVERTSPEAFKSYCIQTVGPLIRVIGDRFPAPVKGAILSTLTIFLTHVPQFVKPFFPQLQRTFVKSLSDSGSLSVRNRGVAALGVLLKHQPRIDPLITELANLVGTEEGEVRDSVVNGLAAVVLSGGNNMGEGSKSALVDLLSEAFAENSKESYATAIGRLLASVAKHDPSAISSLVDTYLLNDLPATQISAIVLREVIDQAPQAFYDLGVQNEVAAKVKANTATTQPPAIARPSREAVQFMKERQPWEGDEKIQSVL